MNWERTGMRSAARSDSEEALRVAIITRRNIVEVSETYPIYPALRAEAARRGIKMVLAPNPRHHHPTLGRNRIEFAQVPWNTFDIAMLVEIEDALNLSDPLLQRRPVLAVDNDARSFGFHSVTFDDYGAGRIAAKYLFDLGHRRFSVIDEVNDPGWPSEITWMARRHGFEAEVGRLGGCIFPQWRIAGGRSRKSLKPAELTRSVAEAWSALPPEQRPTALFAIDQSLLETLIPDLAKKGIRVPRDLSVMVVDWSQVAPVQHGLRYTFIEVELAALVRRAFDVAEELARKDFDPAAPAQLHVAPVLLKPGESTAARKVE
jgi:DNA-binding LacI/PurR family transcriptional regulator